MLTHVYINLFHLVQTSHPQNFSPLNETVPLSSSGLQTHTAQRQTIYRLTCSTQIRNALFPTQQPHKCLDHAPGVPTTRQISHTMIDRLALFFRICNTSRQRSLINHLVLSHKSNSISTKHHSLWMKFTRMLSTRRRSLSRVTMLIIVPLLHS